MSINTKFPGKWTRVNFNNPEPIAFCDLSGMLCMQTDLIKQMRYQGTGPQWTELYVNPRFADVPNPQDLTPILTADPEPVILARPQGEPTQPPFPTPPL
jgi:hypothetical protein